MTTRAPARPTTLFLTLTLVASLAAVAGPASAQVSGDPVPTGADGPLAERAGASDAGVFVTLGGGFGTHDMAGQLALSVVTGQHHVVVRTSGTAEFTLFAPGRSVADFAVLYGRRTEAEKSWARFAAGPSFVTVSRPGPGYDCVWFACSYDVAEENTLGLALQADAVWAPAKAFGIGLTASGNLNPKDSFATVTLGVHLGRVR